MPVVLAGDAGACRDVRLPGSEFLKSALRGTAFGKAFTHLPRQISFSKMVHGKDASSMIYIRLRKRRESSFPNSLLTHEKSALRFFQACSRPKRLTFWNNLVHQLTKLLRLRSPTQI